MDLETLILILFFIVFPIIQQVAEARRRAKAPPPAELEVEDEEGAGIERPRRVRIPVPVEPGTSPGTPGGASWSDAWGSWPGSEVAVEEPDEEESAPAELPVSVVTPHPVPVSLEERGERAIVLRDRNPRTAMHEAERVGELDELSRPWARELPAPVEARRRVPVPRIGPAPALTASVPPVETAGTVVAHPGLAMLRGGSPERLREAFILSEILGSPRAERGFD